MWCEKSQNEKLANNLKESQAELGESCAKSEALSALNTDLQNQLECAKNEHRKQSCRSEKEDIENKTKQKMKEIEEFKGVEIFSDQVVIVDGNVIHLQSPIYKSQAIMDDDSDQQNITDLQNLSDLDEVSIT